MSLLPSQKPKRNKQSVHAIQMPDPTYSCNKQLRPECLSLYRMNALHNIIYILLPLSILIPFYLPTQLPFLISRAPVPSNYPRSGWWNKRVCTVAPVMAIMAKRQWVISCSLAFIISA